MLDRKFPVIEIFGATLQGEGSLIGRRTSFVRFGGCDYQACSWCDTLYAVTPSEVKKNSTYMTVEEIGDRVRDIRSTTVTFSGGNPVIHDLAPVIDELSSFKVVVETQGSIWRDWLLKCEHVTVSPKGPSSKMKTKYNVLTEYVNRLMPRRLNFKIVVFDDEDFEYAKDIHHRFPQVDFYLQVGTLRDTHSIEEIRGDILNRMCWLVDKTLTDITMDSVRVLPQLHTLLWGHSRGV